MKAETFLEQFAHLAKAPNGISKLRELILQLAVRGKLVPQDPNDEPASELLKKIQAGKQRLVAERVVRRARSAPSIKAEETPYALPRDWIWVRLADVGAIVGGGTPRSSDSTNFTEDGIPWLTPADMRGLTGKYVSRGRRDLSESGLASSSATIMPPGTVLFSSRAPIGYVAIAGNEISTNQGFKSVVPYVSDMSEYVHCFLRSAADEIDKNASGTTFKEISGKGMSLVAVPMPPLAEQKRIVAKVDELMVLCDELEAKQQAVRTKQIALNCASLHALTEPNGTSLATAWHRVRDHFDHLYTSPETVSELRQTILQLAVTGRLVPQDPTDEPASELLKKIQAEKQSLFTEKKIRRWRLRAVSDEDLLHSEIPPGWETTALQSVILALQTGPFGSTLHKRDYVAGGMPIVNPKHFRNGKIEPEEGVSVDAATHERLATFQLREGDVILARRGEMGRCAVVTKREDGWLCGTGSAILRLSGDMDSDFVALVLTAPQSRRYLGGESVGSTMTNLNQGILLEMAVALPPRAEQKRIAAKVDQLMTLCDNLEAKLQQSQTDADNLLTATVHELVEVGEGAGTT